MKYILAVLAGLLPVSIYTLTLSGSSGNSISLAQFQGKKILFVNVAVNSRDTAQLGRMKLLQEAYSDSLVVIACPSNDFGNNSLNDDSTRNYILSHYNAQYIITSKMHVKDSLISPLYQWLCSSSQNGLKNSMVRKDFYKYLVDKDGSLLGLFDNSVDPYGALIKRLVGGEQ